jgi:hypothetical protein
MLHGYPGLVSSCVNRKESLDLLRLLGPCLKFGTNFVNPTCHFIDDLDKCLVFN